MMTAKRILELESIALAGLDERGLRTSADAERAIRELSIECMKNAAHETVFAEFKERGDLPYDI